MQKKELVVLSVGGSVIVPHQIDTKYLRAFAAFIKRNLRKFRFVIVTGGGATCRVYQHAARALGVRSLNALDWIGIESTRLNAELVRSLFGNLAEERILVNFRNRVAFRRPIMLAAGDMPGSSSDDDAVSVARMFGAKRIVNLTDRDFVYTADPKKFKDAKQIPLISWQKFVRLVGSKWIPGKKVPFDPVASKLARKHKLEVVVANGKNLANLQKILDRKKFRGTLIS